MTDKSGNLTPEAPDPNHPTGLVPSSAWLDQLGIATVGEEGTSAFTTGSGVGYQSVFVHTGENTPVQVVSASAGDLQTGMAAVRADGQTRAAASPVSG